MWEKIKVIKNGSICVANAIPEHNPPEELNPAKRTETMISLFSKLNENFCAQGVEQVFIPNQPQKKTEPNYLKENYGILLDLEKFDPKRLSPEESVLEFWRNETKGDSIFHEIGEVAFVIYAISPLEVETERDMSKLGVIFSDRRNQLNEDILEDILLIHLNKDLFYKVKERELASIEK